jgi:hypothetical protein
MYPCRSRPLSGDDGTIDRVGDRYYFQCRRRYRCPRGTTGAGADLAQVKTTRVVVAPVREGTQLVAKNILKAGTIRDQVRRGQVFGWYFLPAAPAPINLAESIVACASCTRSNVPSWSTWSQPANVFAVFRPPGVSIWPSTSG